MREISRMTALSGLDLLLPFSKALRAARLSDLISKRVSEGDLASHSRRATKIASASHTEIKVGSFNFAAKRSQSSCVIGSVKYFTILPCRMRMPPKPQGDASVQILALGLPWGGSTDVVVILLPTRCGGRRQSSWRFRVVP